jgi:hypothetical protein
MLETVTYFLNMLLTSRAHTQPAVLSEFLSFLANTLLD